MTITDHMTTDYHGKRKKEKICKKSAIKYNRFAIYMIFSKCEIYITNCFYNHISYLNIIKHCYINFPYMTRQICFYLQNLQVKRIFVEKLCHLHVIP